MPPARSARFIKPHRTPDQRRLWIDDDFALAFDQHFEGQGDVVVSEANTAKGRLLADGSGIDRSVDPVGVFVDGRAVNAFQADPVSAEGILRIVSIDGRFAARAVIDGVKNLVARLHLPGA